MSIIDIPYPIGKGYWTISKEMYIVNYEKLYIKNNDKFVECRSQRLPNWKIKWIKNYRYIKSYIIDEDGARLILSDNKYLVDDDEIEVYLDGNETYIYESEDEADCKLKELLE